jgi:predicted transposase
MKQIITAKLKLNTTEAQCSALRTTQLAYRSALNFVSQYAFEHGKMSNTRKLQSDCYDEIRVVHKLPSQMACNVPRQVGATYKGLWTKVKKNAKDRQSGRTKKRYKGLDKAPKYISPTLTYPRIAQRDESKQTMRRLMTFSERGRTEKESGNER